MQACCPSRGSHQDQDGTQRTAPTLRPRPFSSSLAFFLVRRRTASGTHAASDGPDFHWHANLHQGRVQRMITPSSGEGIYSGRGAGRRGCGVALEPRGWRTRADRAGPDDAPRAGQDTTHVRVHTGVRCRYPRTGEGGGGTHTASSEMRP